MNKVFGVQRIQTGFRGKRGGQPNRRFVKGRAHNSPSKELTAPVEKGPGAGFRSQLLSGGDVIDLQKTFLLLVRRKIFLAATVGTITGITALCVMLMTPLYTASTMIMIEAERHNIVNIESVMAPYLQDRTVVENQILILRSRSFLKKIALDLELIKDPEFNLELITEGGDSFSWGSLDPGGLFPEGWLIEHSLWKTLDPRRLFSKAWGDAVTTPRWTNLNVKEAEEFQLKLLLNKLLKNLEIESIRNTRGITLSYTSKYPDKAALIINTIAERYIVEQLDVKFEATKKATHWLSERLSVLRKKLEESENAVELYRKESGLSSAKGISTQQIAELSSQLIIARSERREAEARLSQVKLVYDSTGGVDSIADVLSSPLIQNLRVREIDLLRKISEFETEYGERHPKMLNVRAEIEDLRRKISKEINKITVGLRNEVQVVGAREESLGRDLDAITQRSSAVSRAEIRLRALEREAEANRALFEIFLARYKETSAQEDMQQPDARVLSRADTPVKSSYPEKMRIVGIAMALSVFIALLLIFTLEQMDSGFRSTEQIESLAGVSALGHIPRITSKRPEEFILEKPGSAYGESIRSLRTSLLLSNVDNPPKVILITSAMPQEGKTTTALSLGRLAAMSGQKAIILECDLRRPTFGARLLKKGRSRNLDRHKGLVELLGQEALLSVVRKTDRSGLDFICAGRSVASTTDLFSSRQMRELTKYLSKEYDLVIFDAPPVLAVSDARVLAAIADKTIFVTRWETTRREVALGGLKLLQEAGADLSGVILSQVNVAKHAKYGYSDSGYYYGKHRRYYTG